MHHRHLAAAAFLAGASILSANDSAVVINEVQYHPAGEPAESEWIELRCLHGVDVDVSGWQLRGGIEYTFPAGTVIRGRGFLVVAQNPAGVAGTTALGPWAGRLANNGEEIRLHNNSGRLMDLLEYRDATEWPAGADGSGATLARRDQTAASGGAGAWMASNQLGGTPGTSNFLDADAVPTVSVALPIDSAGWKYRAAAAAPPADWAATGFDDAGWATGRGMFFTGNPRLAEAVPATAELSGAGDGLISYWAMDDATGSTTAANSVAGGVAGTLSGSPGTNVAFVADSGARSRVLRININATNANVTGSSVSAGTLPLISLATDFTWAFWAKSNDGASNDVILGNRYANAGTTDFNPREFVKFTTSAFEWHVNGGGQNLDYADIANGAWVHHALVKSGPTLTYYRNGSAAGTATVSDAPRNRQPLFMGGNGVNESWSGWLDDVALWSKAVPAAAVAALAAGTYTPANLPTNAQVIDNGPFPVPAAVRFPTAATQAMADEFAGDAIDGSRWEVIDQGLENTQANPLTAAVAGGQVTLAGTTTVNFWAGRTLRSVSAYATRDTVTVEVDRVSLAGTGTAWRSSLWLWADAEHYLHFSQNMNEGGWTWNASDAGGAGTSAPNGGGNNLGLLDSLDAAVGQARMKLVWVPGAYAGQGTIQIWHNATLAASHAVTSWPANFRVLLTGQARAANDTVSAVFDNAKVTVEQAVPFQTGVSAAPTHYFRHEFNFSGAPSATTLSLWPLHDDGAVYYLNGTEIHRDNVGAASGHGAAALASVADPSFPRQAIVIPPGLLQSGRNVLAAAVHQDVPGNADMAFGAQLMASELPAPARRNPPLRLTEISGASDIPFRVELRNGSTAPLSLSGYALRGSSGGTVNLNGTLEPGGFLVLDEAALGFRPANGSRLFLVQGTQFQDGRTVTGRLRGLDAAGAWAFPDGPSFGAVNPVTVSDAVVINEIMYNAPDGLPEQWIELHNRSGAAVDLSGWSFGDGIDYVFPAGSAVLPAGGYAVLAWDPAAFQLLHPGVSQVFGPFNGRLAGNGERIQLRDAWGNVADEVSYGSDGVWPEWASGTSSSLELRNPSADNAVGSAWAASDETSRGSWQTIDYTFQGLIFETNPNFYSELILGLLNDGEVLIDDISVRMAPTGTNTELIQNGNFSAGTAEKWRFAGNTRRSAVVDDPSEPGNKVLRLVQGGSIDHMSNHAETTLKNGSALMGTGALSAAQTYRISFRARWWKGNNRINSHLYFNRGPITTTLARPTTGGTPGARNSTFSESATITVHSVRHEPAVPAAGQPVTVSAVAHDPSGAAALNVIYAVNEGAEQSVPMAWADGRWTATVPGQAAAAKAVFRIEAVNALSHRTTWPASGMAGRAMIPWDDGQAQLVRPNGARPHNVRLVLPASDITLLHAPNNVMSNDWMPCTVIYDEREVYYGTTMHLKGSEHGRAKDVRVGYLVRFPSENLFLGRHGEVGIDRSGAGDQFSQKEILVKRSFNRTGGIPCTEDDLIRVIAPRPQHTGPAIFIHSKIDSDNFLDGQFENGGDGTMYEYELLYPLYSGSMASSTDNGTLEGNKLTQDSPGPTGVPVRKLNPGLSKEEYRWYWLIKNNRTRDDYSRLIPALTALGQTGINFHNQTAALLDTDGWLRSFSGPVVWAVGDNYAFNSQHNCLYYVKPDGRTLYIPWDMDFTATSGATASVNPNTELGKMINSLGGTSVDDVNRRKYYGYLLHMVNTSFNANYMGPWMDHYSRFVNEDYRAGFLSFVTSRESYVRNQINVAVPAVPFRITTNGGLDYTEAASTTTLAGDGWVNVATIRLRGGVPLAVTWTDQDSWRITLPVVSGPNQFQLEAVDPGGNVVGSAAIGVTGTSAVVPASAANIVLTELHYHPVTDGEEFIEILNRSQSVVDLSGCQFTDGITYTFPAGSQLASGTRMLIVQSRPAFAAKYPQVTGLADGEFAPSSLRNSGETITLMAADGLNPVFSVSYTDALSATDGGGRSLVRVIGCLDPGDSYVWRASMVDGGNPGGSDGLPFSGDPLADADSDGFAAIVEYAFGSSDTEFTPSGFFLSVSPSGQPLAATPVQNADCALVELQNSSSLIDWTAAPGNGGRSFWRWKVSLR
jgi:hypothetical protein